MNLISKGIRLFNSNGQILKHCFMSCFLIYSKKDIRSKKNICIFRKRAKRPLRRVPYKFGAFSFNRSC